MNKANSSSKSCCQLFTHAEIYFSNYCLGELEYEATTVAIVMAGIFVTLFIELLSYRMLGKRSPTKVASLATEEDRSSAESDEYCFG